MSSVVGGLQGANKAAEKKNREIADTTRPADSFAHKLDNVISDEDTDTSVDADGANGGGQGRATSEPEPEATHDDQPSPSQDEPFGENGIDLRA
jgi:hypothetical protein